MQFKTLPTQRIRLVFVKTSNKRRFEYTEGTSNKFWEIWQDGRSYSVRFGRIGTNGQVKEKDCFSSLQSQHDILCLVRSKLKKGYHEV